MIDFRNCKLITGGSRTSVIGDRLAGIGYRQFRTLSAVRSGIPSIRSFQNEMYFLGCFLISFIKEST